MDFDQTVFDTLIIGGGPGGLTAAIYLRRFTRNVALVDKGHSRLSWIPVSHNYPGFPEGINGKDLLENLRAQLGNYGGHVIPGEITALRYARGSGSTSTASPASAGDAPAGRFSRASETAKTLTSEES